MFANFVKVAESIPAPKGKPSTDLPLTGMAASDRVVYVAIGTLNKVFMVDAATRKEIGSFHQCARADAAGCPGGAVDHRRAPGGSRDRRGRPERQADRASDLRREESDRAWPQRPRTNCW